MASSSSFFSRFFRPLSFSRDLALGLFFGFSLALSTTSVGLFLANKRKEERAKLLPKRPIELRSGEIVDGVPGLIGNTPLVRIRSLSDLTGVEILGKAEFLNPGGSVKDRVSLRIIEQAEEDGLLRPYTNSRIYEGTVGSTGISIATVAKAKGYQASIIMPDDVASEKAQLLLKLGAQVEKVRPVAIINPTHYVNLAKQKALQHGQTELIGPNVSNSISSSASASNTGSRTDLVLTEGNRKTRQTRPRRSSPNSPLHGDESGYHSSDSDDSRPRGFFADQFENLANYEAHYHSTGPEIWRQSGGEIDVFISGAGTGGTIAGVGRFLKNVKKDVKVVLADPEGSGLYNKVKHGVLWAKQEAEGTKRRYQVDTVVEGIGINRLTRNFEEGYPIIDDAIQVTDAEAVAMSRYLVENDGLFLGSSSAVNLVAAVKLAKRMGLARYTSKKRIVTILCDSGSRHYSKFWNDEYLTKAGIPISSSIDSIWDS